MRVRTLNDEIEKLASYLIQNQASKKSEQWSFRLKFPTRVVKFKSSELLHRTGLYKIRGAWRSVKQSRFSRELEAAKATNIFFSSKLTEPRANQQGKRVRIFR